MLEAVAEKYPTMPYGGTAQSGCQTKHAGPLT